MNDRYQSPVPNVRLRRFDVVPSTPVKDYFLLNGSSVVAESEWDAWTYLTEAAQWREPVTAQRLRTMYAMVPRTVSEPSFNGTKSEWIQAVHFGYCPAPVRLSLEARTQQQLDKEWEEENERHCQRVRELSKLTPWESFRHWLGKQKDHPIFWKLVGFLLLGIVGYIFWQVLVAILVNAVTIFVFVWLVKR